MYNQPYHSLLVWQQGYKFVLEVYRRTEHFPKHEQYNIVSQIRRAAVSVVTNIVEGHAKSSLKDFLRFLDISKGSLTECAMLLELSKDLGYLNEAVYNELESLRAKTGFMLNKFTKSVSQQTSSRTF